jgi:5-methylcytosine-specific restriction endonuclease McrA
MTYETMLTRFQRSSFERPADRLELLRHYAELVPEDRTPQPADVRAERMRCHSLECFGCFTRERMTYWHHVVQVQHGGDNDTRNLVSICYDCHRRIHPWLKDGTTAERRHGFVLLGDYMEAGR